MPFLEVGPEPPGGRPVVRGILPLLEVGPEPPGGRPVVRGILPFLEVGHEPPGGRPVVRGILPFLEVGPEPPVSERTWAARVASITPSPCLAATAAQTHLCCQAPTCHTNDAWRPTRAGATADRQQKQLQRGAGISAVHQRGAAVQQHAGAGGRTLCLLLCLLDDCAMTAERHTRNQRPFV